MSNGLKQMMAEDEASLLTHTSAFKSINGKCDYGDSYTGTKCKAFYEAFKKYFSVAEIKAYTSADKYAVKNLNGVSKGYVDGKVIRFTDGSCVIWPMFTSVHENGITDISTKGKVGNFWFDVNCEKNPNTYGRDIFSFYIFDNGMVSAMGSEAVSEYFIRNGWGNLYWRTSSDRDLCCKMDGRCGGKGCAARVLEEGMMNY